MLWCCIMTFFFIMPAVISGLGNLLLPVILVLAMVKHASAGASVHHGITYMCIVVTVHGHRHMFSEGHMHRFCTGTGYPAQAGF